MHADELRSRVSAVLVTDIGLSRARNEDAAYIDEGGMFFIVADGMGSHAAGHLASHIAVEIVRRALDRARSRFLAFARSPDDAERRSLTDLIETAVRVAHQAVYARATRDLETRGMSAMLDVVVVAGLEAFVAHVGDTRTYLLRQGQAAQITMDHTMAEMLVLEGALSAEEAQASPLRAVLVNAVGTTTEDLLVEIAHVSLEEGDRLLMCTDGLHGSFLDEVEIAEHLAGGAAEGCLLDAIELAKERGGHDNATGIVVDVGEARRASTEDPMIVRDPPSDGAPIAIDEEEVTQRIHVWDAFVVELRDHV